MRVSGDILADGVITAEEERKELKNSLTKSKREILDIPGIDFYSAEMILASLLNGFCVKADLGWDLDGR